MEPLPPGTPYDELFEITKKQARMIEQLKQTLKATQSRTKNMLSSLPLGLIVLTDDLIVRAVNDQVVSTFLFQCDEIVNQPVSTILPQLKELIGHRGASVTDGLRKGGEGFPCEVTVNEVESQSGPLLHFVHVQDITERDRLDKMKAELIRMVSHDLRTPLAAVRAFVLCTERGIYGPISDPGLKAAQDADCSIQYLTSLVDDLLDADQMDSGNLILSPERCTLGWIVETAVNTCKAMAEQRSIELDCRVEDADLFVDRQRLVQALINIISNAIKFSPDSETVKIEAGVASDRALISVQDRGPGIPSTHQVKIFERYQKLSSQNAGPEKGFGLGLAICKSIVEQHGGKIELESEFGKGCTFKISIPAILE
ncbi:MAG: HAMP domain-containing histidine kinase [Cyanobacteria bacterium]|nr:HAMP domain-containing histidine kinase [Cyanobacteriota bacterium]